MDTKLYLQECMEKTGSKTLYKLAQALDIKVELVYAYGKGERVADDYACFKFAECLEIDPAIVIAEIRASDEKNPAKRDYFRSFHGASRKAGVAIMLALALSLSLLSAQSAGDTAKFNLIAGLVTLGGTALARRLYFA